MKLTTKTRYGTRAILTLALSYGKEPVFLGDIAKKERLSVKYLQHIFHLLRNAGIVRSARGVHGGFALARSPSQIKLSEVIRVLEGPLSLVDCVERESACSFSAACATRELWRIVGDSMVSVLDKMTLEDLVNLYHRKTSRLPIEYVI